MGMEKMMKEVHVVTYWSDDPNEEPVVTVFSDEVAAQDCYKYFKEVKEHCCNDRCPVFSSFKIN